MRLYTMFAIAIALLAGLYGLYQLKYQVRDIKREAANLNAQLEEEYKNLHVLKAEWVYLNRPARLEELSRRHLDLVPLAAAQVIEGNAMAVLDVPAEAEEGVSDGDNKLASGANVMQSVTPASEVRYGR